MSSPEPEPLPDTVTPGISPPRGPVLAGHAQFWFGDSGIGHSVYHAGERHHPPLLVMSELAGFSPGMLLMAERLVAAGYQVYLPWLFGPFGRRAPFRNAARLCISREFACLRSGVSAPVTLWLRALTAHISRHNDDARVGAIGMCLTGAFVIPLIIDPHVTTAVAAQPSVPMSLRHLITGREGRNNLAQLNVSEADIAAARQRLHDGDANMLACRFRADRICPPHKVKRLQEEFSQGLEVHEYGEPNWRNCLGDRPHATFTKEYRLAVKAGDADHPAQLAWAELLRFLAQHLRG